MSTGDGQPPPDGSGQVLRFRTSLFFSSRSLPIGDLILLLFKNFPTPTLNNLLSNKSSVGGDAGFQQVCLCWNDQVILCCSAATLECLV